jgi:hypothetical protein
MTDPTDSHAGPARASWMRLMGDHDRIARQCAALAVVARRGDRPYDQATAMLLDLAILVADHMGVEDRVIDLTAAALRFGIAPARATVMHDALQTLKRDWTDFIVRWTPDVIVARWPAFGDDAAAMLARLEEQVRGENELLYAEALDRGIIVRGERILH